MAQDYSIPKSGIPTSGTCWTLLASMRKVTIELPDQLKVDFYAAVQEQRTTLSLAGEEAIKLWMKPQGDKRPVLAGPIAELTPGLRRKVERYARFLKRTPSEQLRTYAICEIEKLLDALDALEELREDRRFKKRKIT